MVRNNLGLNIDSINKSIKWCSASISDVISRGYRLEASVFDVEAKQFFNIVNNGKYKAVALYDGDKMVENAYYGKRLKRNYVDKEHTNSIGFLGSSEMLDVYPKPSKYMVDDDRIKELHIKEGTILLSRSGTIGNATYCGKTLSKFLVSEHAIRLECKYFPGYIYTYLKTDVGKKLINSNIYGAVVQEIEPEHLKMVPIPNAPAELKEKINNLVIESYKLRDESNDLIDQATEMLVKELHLPSIEELSNGITTYKDINAFSVKLSNLSGRVDASYHIPVVNAIVAYLKKYAKEVTTIDDQRISSDVVLPARFKRVYVESDFGVRFLGGKEMKQLDPSNGKYLSKKAHKEQLEGSLGIKPNSILTPARGSLGDVILVCKHFYNWAISDNMMQIISNESVCGYLYIFLNSEYGKTLIQRFTYGGVVDAIEPWHIQQTQIPILKNQDIQTQINNLALKANDLRYKAYCLEQEAIRIMNEEVIYAE